MHYDNLRVLCPLNPLHRIKEDLLAESAFTHGNPHKRDKFNNTPISVIEYLTEATADIYEDSLNFTVVEGSGNKILARV